MRNLLLLIIALFFCNRAGAQDYHPILSDGRIWVMELVIDDIGTEHKQTIIAAVNGDTIVDGRECKRIEVSQYRPDVREPGNRYCKAAYEENGKLYVHGLTGSTLDEFSLLIDMTLPTDGEIPFFQFPLKVISEDVVEVRGVERKRITFGLNYNGLPLTWIEGIGSSMDIYATLVDKPTTWSCINILECYDKGKLIFTRDDFAKGLSSTAINAPTASAAAERASAIYDLSGRRTNGTAHDGIYVTKGKKYVAR